MSRIMEEIREEGKAEGRAEGKAEGRAEGKTEGRAEGVHLARVEFAKKLLSEGKRSLGEIAGFTNLTLDEVKKLSQN